MLTPANISISDVSHLPKFGVKGREAATWLQTHRIALPETANSWVLDQTRLVLRLGNSEFLIEEQQQDRSTQILHSAVQQRPAGLYPVARADASFLITGDALSALMSEICMLDLRPLANSQALYMTQVTGISASLIQQQIEGKAAIRLWCDGTYHAHMLQTLRALADELNAPK